ncbi:MAG TPA: twin-arginine translocation signal domain-containing protein [Cyclobacteriaceae bacterium]|nr:twin-arginine translocation signal domain-containing protein [Cyclobacteriaceae bacterium]
MSFNRRNFIKGLSAGTLLAGTASSLNAMDDFLPSSEMIQRMNPTDKSIIGPYGPWAVSHMKDTPPRSFRSNAYRQVEEWTKETRKFVLEKMAVPPVGPLPTVRVAGQWTFEDLHVEELTWSLPYGRPTQALLLKPANAVGKLPGILAFHDHGGNKFFGIEKITRTRADQHPLMKDHQEWYYEGTAWANEVARRGYAVLISDAFTFASRRVHLSDVPDEIRRGVPDENREEPETIEAYNAWASNHEHIMAKSLLSAGMTWPGVFFAEDRVALDILCNRPDVDNTRIGCGGLSGGGLRTVMMGGLDPRIKCAVCVGFMSTWKDFALNKSWTHTWMTYIPGVPPALDFPEILGLRAPLPTLVQNDEHDALYTLPEMKRADDILRETFNKANALDRYRGSFYPGRHKFDRAMQKEAFEWFDQWLR